LIKKILDGEQIKKILYSVIVDDVGKEKIQTEITLDVGSSQKYIDIIMNKCIAKLCFESYDDSGDDYFYQKSIVTLSEALLHFMLTICTLPSERRITPKNNLVVDIVVDIVVPNLQRLKTKPEQSLIIQFIKEDQELNKVPQLVSLQPNCKNIWLISAKPLSSTKYTTYSVFSNTGFNNRYSDIIIDVYDFLKQTGDKSFRLIH
jgi:hypothetical protein